MERDDANLNSVSSQIRRSRTRSESRNSLPRMAMDRDQRRRDISDKRSSSREEIMRKNRSIQFDENKGIEIGTRETPMQQDVNVSIEPIKIPETYHPGHGTTYTQNNDISGNKNQERNIIYRLQKEMAEMQKKIQFLTLQNQNAREQIYFNQKPRVTRTFDIKNQYPNPFAINVYPNRRNEKTPEYYRPRTQQYGQEQLIRGNQEYRVEEYPRFNSRYHENLTFHDKVGFNRQQTQNRAQLNTNQGLKQGGYIPRNDRNAQYKRLISCPYCKGHDPHNWSLCGVAQDQSRRQSSEKPTDKDSKIQKN